jgi:hypothetical protein
MVCILLCKQDIGCGVIQDLLLPGCVSLLDYLTRDTDNNRTFRYLRTFADESACTYHRSFPDPGTVKHDRTHADKHLIGYRAAMQDRTVTYRNIPAEGDRKTPAGMHDAIVLDVGPVADDDPVLIGPHNRPEPDPNLLSYHDIAGNGCIAGHEECLTGDPAIHMHNNIGN